MDYKISNQQPAIPAIQQGGSATSCGGSNQQELQDKLERVKKLLAGFGKVIVAFSGGVDSTLLAKLALDVLGREQVLVVTANSPSLSQADFKEAQQLAKQLDLQHLVIETKEVDDASYRANTNARCYFCKQELFEELELLAARRAIPFILYGAIGDDRAAERPGQRAAIERGIRAPLQEARLEKWEVRELAKTSGLSNWNRPQNACLSSRIPHGHEVTEVKLKQIEAAETVLHEHGFEQVRVRHLGTHARIEVAQEEVIRFQDAALCDDVARRFELLGFTTVGIDRSGYHPGGANHSIVNEIPLSVNGVRSLNGSVVVDSPRTIQQLNH